MYYISIAALVLMDMHLKIGVLKTLVLVKRMQAFVAVGAGSRSNRTTELAYFVYLGLSRGLDAV